MINTNIAQHAGLFDGFKNTVKLPTFSASYAGGTLPAPGPSTSGYVGPFRAQMAMDNANRVSQVQVRLSGLESFSRLIKGALVINYPNYANWNYQIEIFTYFKNGNIVCDAYIINQYGDDISVPAITFQYNVSLFVPPF